MTFLFYSCKNFSLSKQITIAFIASYFYVIDYCVFKQPDKKIWFFFFKNFIIY